jgi:UDP-N-acetyl-D-galactosamine dehydrogenase
MLRPLEDTRIAVIGLGYVGLPLAVAFAGRYPTLGFDIDRERVGQLRAGHDGTGEVSRDELAGATQLELIADADALAQANVYVVTVPTRHRHGQAPRHAGPAGGEPPWARCSPRATS